MEKMPELIIIALLIITAYYFGKYRAGKAYCKMLDEARQDIKLITNSMLRLDRLKQQQFKDLQGKYGHYE